MIKNSPIVEDIRRIRHKISEKFDHDIDRYIAYLQSEQARRAKESSCSSEAQIAEEESCKQEHKADRAKKQ